MCEYGVFSRWYTELRDTSIYSYRTLAWVDLTHEENSKICELQGMCNKREERIPKLQLVS